MIFKSFSRGGSYRSFSWKVQRKKFHKKTYRRILFGHPVCVIHIVYAKTNTNLYLHIQIKHTHTYT